MKTQNNPQNEAVSKFFLEELEQRLETDPLSIGGLFEIGGTDENCIGSFQTCTCYQHLGTCHDYIHCENGYSS